MKKSNIVYFSIILLISLITIVFVQHDEFLYKVPVGQITKVKNSPTVSQTDNFNNQDTQTTQALEATILNGKFKHKKVLIKNDFSSSNAFDQPYYKGQKVILHLNNNHKTATITNLKRDASLAILLILAVDLLLVMKETGIRALFSLILNIILFFTAIEIDLGFQGQHVLLIFSFLTIIFSFLTLLFVLGWNPKMRLSFITTIAGTFLAIMIALVVFHLTKQRGLHFETMEYVTQNPQPLFLAEVLLGSLGAVMDESTDIIISLFAMIQQNPKISLAKLWQSSRQIGKTIMGPLLNVLFMIFMADTFSMMVLYLRNGNSFGYSFTMNMALGFVQTLISGIGIVLTIPIASFLVGFYWRKWGLKHD